MNRARLPRLLRRMSYFPPFSAFTRLCASVGLTIGVLLSPVAAPADFDTRLWNDYLTQATSCRTPGDGGSASEGARCLAANGFKLMLNEGLRAAEAHGKTAFGAHFQAVGQLRSGPFSDGATVYGDIDMVLPLAGAGAPFARPAGSAFFFQQGMTRAWDETGSGLTRNDLRHGLVRRLRVSKDAAAGILGVSAFHLFNTERGHRVVVSGVDYTGSWGVGSLRYYRPTTGWRPGGSGREERALDGIEVGMRFDLTTTVRVDAVGHRWRADDGSNRWDTGARVGIGWRPHPWLKLAAGYDRIGRGKDTASFGLALHVPLGEGSTPRWQGLGVAADPSPPDAGDLWRPVDDIGPIKVATRETASGAALEPTVRFLQRTAASGTAVRLEVTLPAAAPKDIRVVVRLVPGDGENPAVAGEDFIDLPVETTIRKGATRTTVSFTLLRNDGMTGNRSLGATVSAVS